MDFRKQHSMHNSQFKNSQRSSFGASQSGISTKEVIVMPKPAEAPREAPRDKNITKERVSQVVHQAENMLRSERKPRPLDESHRGPQQTLKHVEHQPSQRQQ